MPIRSLTARQGETALALFRAVLLLAAAAFLGLLGMQAWRLLG